MKRQYILAIVPFSATFIFSVFVYSLVAPLFIEVNPLPVSVPSATENVSKDSQKQIRSLLERDRQHGFELAREYRSVGAFEYDVSTLERLKRAAVPVRLLVAKMERNDSSDLPLDVATAWRAHKNAWRSYSRFLREIGTSSDLRLDDEDLELIYEERNEEISSTYNDLLESARAYGVDFKE